MIIPDAQTVNSVSHLIALSVAPVFLMASVGALLGVFTGRLSRIINKFETIDAQIVSSYENDKTQQLHRQRSFLEKRADNMNVSIFFCTATGILVAFSIVTIFMSAFFVFDGSLLIAILFILGMLSLVMALLLFLREIILARKFLKRDIIH